jgi:hypothetical protein
LDISTNFQRKNQCHYFLKFKKAENDPEENIVNGKKNEISRQFSIYLDNVLK